MSFTNFYFGIDGDSEAAFHCAGNGPNYYIGKLGGETTAGGGSAWSQACANLATPTYTHSYWDVAGPNGRTGSDAYAWGTEQASAFFNAFTANVYVNGLTLFGDVESGNGGWLSDTASNQQVLYGFLNELKSKGVTPGVYIEQSFWNPTFGTTWQSPVPFVLWVASSYCATDTCALAESNFNSLMSGVNFGGYKIMLWQYNINSCGASAFNSDLDITPYSGYENGTWNPTKV